MNATATEDQLRWGTAATLLSLDRVRPFYAMMGVPTQDPDALIRQVRKAIVENRQVFARDPSHVPDLRGRLLDTLSDLSGAETAQAFEVWVANGFVYSPRDLLPADDWWQVLLLSRRRDDRWDLLGLPPGLSAEARLRLGRAASKEELHELDDQVAAQRLSLWDVEIYALHGYDSEDNDPYHRVNLTVLKRAMLAYLRWLAAALSNVERASLLDGAERVRRQIDAMSGTDPLQDLARVI